MLYLHSSKIYWLINSLPSSFLFLSKNYRGCCPWNLVWVRKFIKSFDNQTSTHHQIFKNVSEKITSRLEAWTLSLDLYIVNYFEVYFFVNLHYKWLKKIDISLVNFDLVLEKNCALDFWGTGQMIYLKEVFIRVLPSSIQIHSRAIWKPNDMVEFSLYNWSRLSAIW